MMGMASLEGPSARVQHAPVLCHTCVSETLRWRGWRWLLHSLANTHVLHLGPQVALMGPGGGSFVDAHDPFSEGPGARVQHAADARSRAISPEPFRVARARMGGLRRRHPAAGAPAGRRMTPHAAVARVLLC